MTRYLIFREKSAYQDAYYVDYLTIQTLEEKIHVAKQLLVTLVAVQIEFWHSGSRYTIEFDIQNTL